MTSEAAIRRFESWDEYNAAVDEQFRYNAQRDDWPTEYNNADEGIDSNLSDHPESVRILFLPHGFAMAGSGDEMVGNLVACSMTYQPPVALLAERLRFKIAKALLVERPRTLKRTMQVLQAASDGDDQ